jgi:hypothetical protein
VKEEVGYRVESVNVSPSKPQDIWRIGGTAAIILTSALHESQETPKFFAWIS